MALILLRLTTDFLKSKCEHKHQKVASTKTSFKKLTLNHLLSSALSLYISVFEYSEAFLITTVYIFKLSFNTMI